jgi:hypothetical protein
MRQGCGLGSYKTPAKLRHPIFSKKSDVWGEVTSIEFGPIGVLRLVVVDPS